VRYRGLSLQIPPSPLRPHFVKARVRVHDYPDGTRAIFHGRAASPATGPTAARATTMRCSPPDAAGRPALWICGQASGLPTAPQAPTTTAVNPCATNTGQLNVLSTVFPTHLATLRRPIMAPITWPVAAAPGANFRMWLGSALQPGVSTTRTRLRPDIRAFRPLCSFHHPAAGLICLRFVERWSC
jgi:hypothetical protein